MVSLLTADHQTRQILVTGFLAVAIPAVGFLMVPPGPFLRRFSKRGACCPHCESQNVRPARIQSILDSLRTLIKLYPFRCRACRTRYLQLGETAEVGTYPNQNNPT